MQAHARLLDKCLEGDVAIIGIGNRWRGDDAAGPLVIDRLRGRVVACCIDAGEAPERHLGEVPSEADAVVLVDAVDFGGRPGQVALFAMPDLTDRFGTTHDVPLRVLMRYLQAQTGAQVLLLGIQPACTALGAEMSAGVGASVELIAQTLTARLTREHTPACAGQSGGEGESQ